jgi:hypothetical protein
MQCIKITVSGDYRQHDDDIKYYHRLMKRHIDWSHLAQFYTDCKTNLGIGLIFEVVKDYNGSVSKSLGHQLESHDLIIDSPCLNIELSALKSYLLDQCIIVRDLKDDNILVQYLNEEKYRLVIIDGVGNNEFIPISGLTKHLTHRKIERKWAKFFNKLQIKFSR